MNWRYVTAQRLSFLTLILAVLMLMLLPWSWRPGRQDAGDEDEMDD